MNRPNLSDVFPHVAWAVAPDGALEDVNGRWVASTGLSAQESRGAGWLKVLHPHDVARAVEGWSEAIASGEEQTHQWRFYQKKDVTYRWMLVRAAPVRDASGQIVRWFATATDIDDQKRVETQLALLVRAGSVLASSLDYATTLHNVARLSVQTLASFCLFDVVGPDGRVDLVASAHAEAARDPILRTAGRFLHGDRPTTHVVLRTIESGASVLVPEVDERWIEMEATSDEHAEFMRRLAYRSLMIVPVVRQDQVFGTLTLCLDERALRRFDLRDLAFAEELGRRAGVALSNAMRYGREAQVASSFQAASLPLTLPRIPGINFDAVYIPAKSDAEVGGDWYDAFELPDGRIVISVGDVAGSGLDAAVTMSKMRQAIRSVAYLQPEPSAILTGADLTLKAERPNAIVTAVAAIFDPRFRTLTYASAGHPAPIVRRPDGSLFQTISSGLPLGLRTGDELLPERIIVANGSLVTFYTDGLTESTRNLAEGERRVREALAPAAILDDAHPAAALRDAILFDGSHDDVAILTMRVGSSAAGAGSSYPQERAS